MAILPSAYGTQSGIHMLTELLQGQVSQGQSLTVTDQIISSFLWSVGVSNQYMGSSAPDPQELVREMVVGMIANLHT